MLSCFSLALRPGIVDVILSHSFVPLADQYLPGFCCDGDVTSASVMGGFPLSYVAWRDGCSVLRPVSLSASQTANRFVNVLKVSRVHLHLYLDMIQIVKMHEMTTCKLGISVASISRAEDVFSRTAFHQFLNISNRMLVFFPHLYSKLRFCICFGLAGLQLFSCMQMCLVLTGSTRRWCLWTSDKGTRTTSTQSTRSTACCMFTWRASLAVSHSWALSAASCHPALKSTR